MEENTKMREKGFKRVMNDIEEMGIAWAKHIFALSLRCTGVDPWFTVGYGEAIVVQEMTGPT